MAAERMREQIGRMNQGMNSVCGQGESYPSAPDRVQEHAWVEASQRGDTLAFNRLVLKWERTVFNVALRMLQDRDEAEEATQEIFLSAFKNIRRFRLDAKFSTWVYRIAVNHCISRARRRPQGTHLPLDGCDQDEMPAPQLRVAETQEGQLLQAESRSRVRTALRFLPPDLRAVIELKFFQELTFEEIAEILEAPLSTIKSRLYTGLDSLKVRLGGKA
jgi:RNA polymerase sigma-70 factor (ECF subfamily)